MAPSCSSLPVTGALRVRKGLESIRNEAPAALAMLAERTKHAAPGIAGGEEGDLGKLEINGEAVDPKAQHIVQKGDRLILATPGGGGFGAAADRDVADSGRDTSLGYTGN